MKILNNILFFCFILLACSGSTKIEKNKNDWKDYKLKGKVKSVKCLYYQCKVNQGKIEKGKLSQMGAYKYTFNKKGYLLKDEKYKSDNKIFLYGQWTYTYDEKDRKMEEHRTIEAKYEGKTVYKYDGKSNKIAEIFYEKNDSFGGELKYEYDDKGNAIKECFYDDDHKLERTTKYKYDDKGNLIEEGYYKNAYQGKITYKYDDKGNMIEQDWHNIDGKIVNKMTVAYDKYNNIIEENWSDLIRTYKYKYDKKGNWIEQIMYKNGTPIEIAERDIYYF